MPKIVTCNVIEEVREYTFIYTPVKDIMSFLYIYFLRYNIYIFRKFQPMTSIFDNSLSLDQDINQFLV